MPHPRRHLLLRLLDWPARRPRLTLGLALLCTLLAGWRLAQVRLNSSLDAMLDRRDPATAALARVLGDFAATDDLLVLVSLPEADRADPAAGIERLRAFAQRFEALVQESPVAQDYCAGVTWRVDPQWEGFIRQVLLPAGLYYLDDAQFAALGHRLTRAEMQRQIAQNEAMLAAPGPAGALAKVLLQDPLRLREFATARLAALRPTFQTYAQGDEFIAPDGRHLLILVHGRRPSADLPFARAFTDTIGRVAAAVNRDGLKLDYAGAYAIAAYSERTIRRDMILNTVSSLAMIQVLFLLAYRGLGGFALTVLPTVLGIVAGFGVFALFTPTLTPLTAAIGGILAGLGIDYAVLYLAQYRQRRGRAAPQAARRAGRAVGLALVSGCATSVAGFASIALSPVQGLRDFAALGSLGLAGALIGALTVLPAMLRLLDAWPGAAAQAGAPRWLGAGLLRWTQRWRVALIVGMSAIFLAAVAVIVMHTARGAWFESDVTVMHPRPNPPLAAQQRIADVFGFPPTVLMVHLSAATPEELVHLSHEVERRLRNLPEPARGLVRTLGLATVLPDPAAVAARERQMRDFPIDQAVADFRAVVQESAFEVKDYEPYMAGLKGLFGAKPPGIEAVQATPALAAMFLPRQGPATQALTLVFVRDSLDDRARREAVVTALRAALADVPGARLTGLVVVAQDLERAVRRDLGKFALVSGVIVVGWVALLFRRARPALLALVPVGFGMAVMLAYMALAGERFNLANLLAVPLLAGCGEDYGLFLVSVAQARRPRRRGGGADAGSIPSDSAPASGELGATCHAIIVANLASVLGFGSLAFTSTPALQSLGRAVGVGMLACLAGTLGLLLPILLRKRDDRTA